MRLPVWMAGLFVAGAVLAQQPTSLIPGDPLACFSMSGAPAQNLSVVSVSGPGFDRALRIRTPFDSANPWDIRARCFNTRPANQGDTVLAVFWMRTLTSQRGVGLTTFVVEKGREPWTKSAEFTTGAGAEWKKVEIPFTMRETYRGTGPEGYNISFWVTFGPQEIEIGGLSVVNYGPNVPYRQLGLTVWPYSGREADAPWRKAAEERIERIRKGDIVVAVRDDQGNPVAGAQVRVRMKRHAFGFGSAVAGHGLMDNSPAGQKYQEMIPKLFNKVVLENDLKWPFWETWSRNSAAFALEWLPARGITDIRGHNVIWPDRGNLPPDVVSLLNAGNRDALRQRIYDHIREIMTWTKGKVTEWDVLNEPYTSRDVQALLGDAEIAVWFQKAREADPGVKLYINDFNIVEAGGWDVRHQDFYYDTIKAILDAGAPLDGIGLQGHFNQNLTPPERVLEILDRFARFGKELQITEFDVTPGDEQIQAEYTRDFLTVCFSHPAVTGFLIWGFWEGRHWRPEAAMYRRDWSIKPNGEVWQELIFNKWWTDVAGMTGADGTFRTRGFLGDYEVEITAGGTTRTYPLKVASREVNHLVAGKAPAPAITEEGIVNAASFRGGAVAPGELVTIFGRGFGPASLAVAEYDTSGRLPRIVGDTRVLFDGLPAPMVYALAGQASAVVPRPAGGTTAIAVEYLGVRSNTVVLPVAAAAPGVFTRDATGRGPAAAVNVGDEGSTSLNSSERPARKGRFVSLWITGAGATSPEIEDGLLPVFPNHPPPTLPVVVTFGGVESRFADNWAGLVYPGVVQLNVRVPLEAPSGPGVPLRVSVGGAASQDGVTIAIE
ncbi:MAG: endo-1,4-beta-xylanase [Bryobacteraceae bacterium]|nr:endo-1,4-beta-xylanase [Bryobacteraceae bacterium]